MPVPALAPSRLPVPSLRQEGKKPRSSKPRAPRAALSEDRLVQCAYCCYRGFRSTIIKVRAPGVFLWLLLATPVPPPPLTHFL